VKRSSPRRLARPAGRTAGKSDEPAGGHRADAATIISSVELRGTLDGQPAVMVAEHEGSVWRARVEVGGAIYALEGSVAGDQVQGLAQDLASGHQAPLLAQLDAGGVSILVPVQGRLDVVEVESSDSSTDEDAGSDAGSEGPLDSRLVGEWLWTDQSTGPPFILLQERLILREDGTFAYGDAKVAGGGVSDPGGAGYQTGRWRADGERLYVHTGAGFQQYASYSTDGRSLLLRFLDGSQRYWKRAGV
jgi:hypothetical protein